MEDRIICDQTKRVFAEPFPEDNVIIHRCRLQLLLCRQVENLNRPRLRLEGNDVFVPVHDSTIGIDGASDDFIVVFEVDDDDLWFVFIVELLPDADIVIGF